MQWKPLWATCTKSEDFSEKELCSHRVPNLGPLPWEAVYSDCKSKYTDIWREEVSWADIWTRHGRLNLQIVSCRFTCTYGGSNSSSSCEHAIHEIQTTGGICDTAYSKADSMTEFLTANTMFYLDLGSTLSMVFSRWCDSLEYEVFAFLYDLQNQRCTLLHSWWWVMTIRFSSSRCLKFDLLRSEV